MAGRFFVCKTRIAFVFMRRYHEMERNVYSRASNKCIAKNLIIASVREIVMKGFTKWLVILLLFLFIPEGGVMEQGDQSEAWNWQILDRAQGEWLEKANKAVADIRFIDETHIPKKETVRYTDRKSVV